MEEIESLHVNNTWELTKLPKGKKVIGCKWIFAKNDGSPNITVRYKARLVTLCSEGGYWFVNFKSCFMDWSSHLYSSI